MVSALPVGVYGGGSGYPAPGIRGMAPSPRAGREWAAGVRYLPRPTIRGPRRLQIAGRTFGIPSDARLIRCRDRAQAVVFVVADGLLYCLTPHGQADLPIAAEDALLDRFGDRVPDTDNLFFEGRAAYRSAVIV